METAPHTVRSAETLEEFREIFKAGPFRWGWVGYSRDFHTLYLGHGPNIAHFLHRKEREDRGCNGWDLARFPDDLRFPVRLVSYQMEE